MKDLLQDLYSRSPDISGPPGKTFVTTGQALCERSLQELSTWSLHKTSIKDLNTRRFDLLIFLEFLAIELFWQELFTRLPHNTCMKDPSTRSLYKISWYLWASWQDLCEKKTSTSFTRSRCKISMEDLYARSPHISARPLWEISSQDLRSSGSLTLASGKTSFTIARC